MGDRGGRTGFTKTVGLGDGLPVLARGLGFGVGLDTDGLGDGVVSGIGVGVGLVLAIDPMSAFMRKTVTITMIPTTSTIPISAVAKRPADKARGGGPIEGAVALTILG